MINNHSILTIRFIACFHKHFLILNRFTCTCIIGCYRTGFNCTPCRTVCTLLQFVGDLTYRLNLSINTRLFAVLDIDRSGKSVLCHFRRIADMHVSGSIVSGISNRISINLAVCRRQDSQRCIEGNLSCSINSLTCTGYFKFTFTEDQITSVTRVQGYTGSLCGCCGNISRQFHGAIRNNGICNGSNVHCTAIKCHGFTYHAI